MDNNKQFVREYLTALSGKPKTPEMVARYVNDSHLAEHIANVEAAFPGYEIIIDDMLAEGGKVVVRGTFRGTHKGPFAGVQPTNQSVSAGLIIIYEVTAGRISNHWMQFDLFSLMTQLNQASAFLSA